MSYYIYKFISDSDEILYVGITSDIKGRVQSQHFGANGHLPEECYLETALILHSKCLTRDDAKIKERYLINHLIPKYNELLNNASRFNFVIDDFEWKYIPFDRESMLEKRQKKRDKESNYPQRITLEDHNIKIAERALVSLGGNGPLLLSKENPGRTIKVLTWGDHQIDAIAINGSAWLPAIQLAYFSGEQQWEASQIRLIQFINQGFLTNGDVLLMHSRRFIHENKHVFSWYGRERETLPDSMILIKANCFEGYVDGLIHRRTKDVRKKLAASGRARESWLNDGSWFYDLETYIQWHVERGRRDIYNVKNSIEAVVGKLGQIEIVSPPTAWVATAELAKNP